MMLRVIKKVPFNGIVVVGHRWMSNTVMSFGDGTHDALGLPPSITATGSAYEPTPISTLPPDVSTIAAGHHHSLAVTSQGHLWSWGRNVEFQLGRGLHSPRETWFEPQRIDGLIGVKSAFASGVVSAAISVDGSLWVWGKSNRGQLGLGEGITEAVLPSRIKSLDKEEIIKVSFGCGHALALAKNGKLFGWGYSADGRLGKRGVSDKKKDSAIIIWEPCLIDDLDGVEVADISCGLDHTLVLLRDGTLLSGGSNVCGQLGRSTQDLELLPVDISVHPISISSGLGHSLAICQIPSADGGRGISDIFSWGCSRDSQLGREGPSNIPLLVDGLLGENLFSVSGRHGPSIALTSAGEIFAWGCGRNGRLGLGSSMDELEPMLVELSEGTKVLQVVSGFDHNLILT